MDQPITHRGRGASDRRDSGRPAVVQQVRIDHRGANIVVAQQVLDRAIIVAIGQPKRGEGVT